MREKAGLGSLVSICYRGGIKGQEPVDVRSEEEPLTVMIGDLKLPRGIEEALVGMSPGEEKVVDLTPDLGYGERQEALAQWYPRHMVDSGYTLKVGDVMFHVNPEDGHRQPAFVTQATKDNVMIDFNHPFAGETLSYWVKLVDLR